MKFCVFCPDCKGYEINATEEGTVHYCPYCGAKLLKNYEVELVRDPVSFELLVVRRPINDNEVLRKYFNSDRTLSQLTKKRAKKRRKILLKRKK